MSPEQTSAVLTELDRALAAAGRSREGFEIIITPATEDPEAIAAFSDLGVHRLILHLGSQRAEKLAPRMDQLASLVQAAA